MKVGVAVTDLTTGLYTSNSVMAALLARMKTGRGQHIDVALSDCQVATLANIASSCLISGQKDTGRWGTSHRASNNSSRRHQLTRTSFNRTLQGLQDIGWRHPARWWQRSSLWCLVQSDRKARTDQRRTIQDERGPSAEQRYSRGHYRARDEAKDDTGMARHPGGLRHAYVFSRPAVEQAS